MYSTGIRNISLVRPLPSYDCLYVPQSTQDSAAELNPTHEHFLSTVKSIIVAFNKKNEYGEWIMLGERSGGCERVV